MAGNFFDQFDPTPEPQAPARRNFFDQFDEAKPAQAAPAKPAVHDYDPMRIAIASMNAGEVAKAQTQTAPAAPPSPDAAHRQHASPMVRDVEGGDRGIWQRFFGPRTGPFLRKPLGEVDEGAEFPVYRNDAGQVLGINPATDVVLRDPVTNKLMAFERRDELDKQNALEGLAHAILPGVAANAPTRIASSGAIPMAVQRGAALGFPVPAKTYQMGERVRDAAAFDTLETPVFAPAFRSKGAARVARTVEEMPGLGGIVKTPKTETELALKEAQAGIAHDLGAAATDEQAGRILQGGLDRFRTARLQQIEPGVVQAAGIEPFSPVQASAATSRGAATRAEAAAPIIPSIGADVARTSRGAEVAPARPLSEVYRARTRIEDLSDAQLATVVRTPAEQTSFATRADALYESARRNLPALFKRNGAANPNEIATPNAQVVARGLMQQEQSARISGGMLEGRFGGLVKALSNPQAPFTVDSLLASRREIGRALASFGQYDARLDRSQLKEIYGAITRDLEVGIRDLAHRAALGTRQHNQAGLQYFGPPRISRGPNGEEIKTPTQVSPEVARRAAQALRDFRVADRYYRGAISQMDRFTKLLNADSPEAAVRMLATRMKEGTIDRGLIRTVAESLHPEESNAVLGYLVARMGQRAGSKEAEHVWDLHTFATDWNKNKSALALMMRNAEPGVREKLNALAQVSERMKYYETTKNYSGSAYAGIPGVGLLTLGASGNPVTGLMGALTVVGGGAAVGKFLTTPHYLDWMVKAAQNGAVPRARGPQFGGTQAPARTQNALTVLRQVAANDNELGPIITQALDLLEKRRAKGEEERGSEQP